MNSPDLRGVVAPRNASERRECGSSRFSERNNRDGHAYLYFARLFFLKARALRRDRRTDTILPDLLTLRSFFVNPPVVCWAFPSHT